MRTEEAERAIYVWATPPKQVETAYNSCIAKDVESAQNLLAGENFELEAYLVLNSCRLILGHTSNS